MNTNSKARMATREGPGPANAEKRLNELGIQLPAPPEPECFPPRAAERNSSGASARS